MSVTKCCSNIATEGRYWVHFGSHFKVYCT